MSLIAYNAPEVVSLEAIDSLAVQQLLVANQQQVEGADGHLRVADDDHVTP